MTEYFSDSLGEVKIDLEGRHEPRSIPLGPAAPMTPARKGEFFFHDARICFQQWQSCASCHPDGRADGLNWDLLNDGMGNPKQTKSMLLAHKTPPAMAMGVREAAELAVRKGIQVILMTVQPEECGAAMDEYLKALQPVKPPPRPAPLVQSGQAVFQKAGCATCHPAPLYTNLKGYNLGTGLGQDQGKELDTPTLIECWRTAPYLHDGRAATLRDVLTTFNKDDKHGSTSKLSKEELDALVAFLESL